MNSQLNNSNENQDLVFQETDTFRPVFFDSSAKRNSSLASSDPAKRARLDASVIAPKDTQQDAIQLNPLPPSSSPGKLSNSGPLLNQHRPSLHHRHLLLQHHLLLQPSLPTPDQQRPVSAQDVDVDVDMDQEKAPKKQPATPQPLSQKLPLLLLLVKTPHHRSAHRSAKKAVRVLPVASQGPKAPKFVRRFRSRSLPIINYTSRSQLFQHHVLQRVPHQQLNLLSSSQHLSFFLQPSAPSSLHYHTPSTPSLPPINLQLLKEIDLHEILKNPQLRHDILFDPQLQFRPNLDGERGRRKKTIIEKYWSEIEAECKQYFQGPTKPSAVKLPRLPVLFTTLRDILLSLLPVKDRAPVNEIMDIDLLVQQLSHGSFDFVAMAKWLGEVFKSHCAPMRDQWVSDMIAKFQQAYDENSVEKLVQGLRTIFFILEAMKLDVANHQIRILRPVLIETANEFEKDYFDQLINHCKIDITDSLKWYYRNYHKKSDIAKQVNKENMLDADQSKAIIVSAIIDLLSCRNMATEFPLTLAFDHTRLVLLRADVRQLVCVQLCVVLFKQLLFNYLPSASYRAVSSKPEYLTKVQEEILAIVTDDNGNVKWTRNVQAIALQLVKNVVTDPTTGKQVTNNLPQSMVEFGYNWLIKQIQPNSDVYGLMEDKIFKQLLTEIVVNLNFDGAITASSLNNDFKRGVPGKNKKSDLEMVSIASRISTLVKFHWSVFGEYYTNYVKNDKASL